MRTLIFKGLFLVALATSCAEERDMRQTLYGSKDTYSNQLVAGRIPAGPKVVTTLGSIMGKSDGRTDSFLGIPYATIPERWQEADGVRPWSGDLIAQSYKPSCLRRVGAGENAMVEGDEDCLYLNVWRPARHSVRERPLPVLFWIHGGGFARGSGSSYDPWTDYGLPSSNFDLYNGEELAKRYGVIVVTINYRLGILGFFGDPRLKAANLGLKDQIEALQWVKSHIGAFGGDAGRVLVFGESAGAYATCALLASPMAKGLFSRAAMQSHVCWSRTAEESSAVAALQLERLPCDGDLQCLRRLSGKEIVEGQLEKVEGGLPGFGELPYVPTVDQEVLLETSRAAVASGRWNQVPLIIGGNDAEASIVALAGESPKSWSELRNFIYDLPIGKREKETLVRHYSFPRYLTSGQGPSSAFSALATDMFMTCPQSQQAREAAVSSSMPIYRYIFTRGVPDYAGIVDATLGAFHGAELFFLFQKMGQTSLGVPGIGDFRTERIMGELWSSFAANGVPTSSTARLVWPATRSGRFGVRQVTLELNALPKVHWDYKSTPCGAMHALLE